MQALTLTATFDGEHIRLEDPHVLPKKARLLVTVLPDNDELAKERADWLTLSAQGLARACGPDEPDYPDSLHQGAQSAPCRAVNPPLPLLVETNTVTP